MRSMDAVIAIEKLERPTLLGMLTERIEEWILSGHLTAGQKLPAEGVLAARFGVSRPIVREALSQLRERGLIRTVTGHGTFVREPDPSHVGDTLLRHLRLSGSDPASIRNLYEARNAVEVEATALAATRRTESDLSEIARRVGEMRAARQDQTRWTNADLGFHLAVAASARNPLLAMLLAPLVKVIQDGIAATHRSRQAVAAGLRAHTRILRAIEASDPAAAAEAMRAHLRESEHFFTKTFALAHRR